MSFSYDKIYTAAYVPVKLFENNKIKSLYVVFVDDTAFAINYAKESLYRYIGQLILVRNDDGKNSSNPMVYEITSLNGDLKHIGTPMLDNEGFICLSYSQYIVGQLAYFGYIQYFYNGKEFLPVYGDESQGSTINHSINTVDDIINAFDELQKRATELGMPIHCFRDDDYTLTLQYDELSHRMLIATKIKTSLVDLNLKDVKL